MVCRVKFPVVFSILLLAGRKVTVSFAVHGCDLFVFIGCSVSGVEHVLGILETLTGDAKFHVSVFGLGGPLVTPSVAFAQGLSHVRGVLVFFDVVEFILHARKGLGLDHFLNGFGPGDNFTVAVTFGELHWVFGNSVMLLDLAWLVNVRLPELF